MNIPTSAPYTDGIIPNVNRGIRVPTDWNDLPDHAKEEFDKLEAAAESATTDENNDQAKKGSSVVIPLTKGKNIVEQQEPIPDNDKQILYDVVITALNSIPVNGNRNDSRNNNCLDGVIWALNNFFPHDRPRNKKVFDAWLKSKDSTASYFDYACDKAKDKVPVMPIDRIFKLARDEHNRIERRPDGTGIRIEPYPCAFYEIIRTAKEHNVPALVEEPENIEKLAVLRRWMPTQFGYFIATLDKNIRGRKKRIEQKVLDACASRYPENNEFARPPNLVDLVKGLLVEHEIDLYYDEFARMEFASEKGNGPTSINDAYIRELWLRFTEAGHKIPKGVFADVIEGLAHRNPRHPVREYLNELKVNGPAEIDTWLFTYCKVKPRDEDHKRYVSEVGRKILLAAVYRIFEPGTKFDEILLLEGPQQCRKSTLISALAVKDEWFTESLALTDTQKELMETMDGAWWGEFPELAGMRKSDAEAVKAMLSRRANKRRRAYGRKADREEIHYILAGTINRENDEDRYLTDQTGNRRFLPVPVCPDEGDVIDIDGFIKARDQLYAEAMQCYRARESVVFSDDVKRIAAIEQSLRTIKNPMLDTLASYLSVIDAGTILVEDVRKLVGIRSSDWNGNKQLGICMQKLGFDNIQVQWLGMGKPYCYRRKGVNNPKFVVTTTMSNRVKIKQVTSETGEILRDAGEEF